MAARKEINEKAPEMFQEAFKLRGENKAQQPTLNLSAEDITKILEKTEQVKED